MMGSFESYIRGISAEFAGRPRHEASQDGSKRQEHCGPRHSLLSSGGRGRRFKSSHSDHIY
jgi:hypothetical protein